MFEPKMQVEIIYRNGDRTLRKCPIEDNKVVIKPGHRGKGGLAWKPSFEPSSIITPKRRYFYFWEKTMGKRVMVLEGSEKCVNFHSKSVDLNGLTRYDLQALSDLEVIRRSGEVKIKHEFPLVFWLIVGFSAANLILSLINMTRTGRPF